MGRPLLFYSAWPLGYHNLGAERRARALAQAGYDVTYVAGIGIRNPSLSNLPKLVDRSARKIGQVLSARHRLGQRSSDANNDDLREGSLLVVPPRQYALTRRLNAVWIEHQLQAQLHPWRDTVAWIRWPTPELVEALRCKPPYRIIYEAVDAYEVSPGIVGAWETILRTAERRMVELSDLIVVPGEKLAERYRGLGGSVRVIPHGVDLIPWKGRTGEVGNPVSIGFAGTIDARIDTDVLRAVAIAHPEWRLRFVGPVQDGFNHRAIEGLPNIVMEPPVPAAEIPGLVASFDAGLMPYVNNDNTAHMNPVKNLEYLAAGIPAVARRLPALEPYGDLVYFADSPAEFVAQLERALREQSAEAAEKRRQRAEPHSWPSRLTEFVRVADELSGGAELPPTSHADAVSPGWAQGS